MSKSADVRPRRGRKLLAWLVGVTALLGVAASLGLRVAEGLARERIGAIGERLGLSISVGDIDLPWVGGITLRGVAVDVEREDGPVRLASLPRVETDLSLVAVLSGARRPGAVRVVGGWLHGRVDDEGLAGVPDGRRTGGAQDTGGGDGDGLKLTFEDTTVRLDARFEGPRILAAAKALVTRLSDEAVVEAGRGAVVMAPIVVRGLEGELTRGANGAIALGGRGRVDGPGGVVPVEVELALTRGGGVSARVASADGGLMHTRVDTPWGPLHAGARLLSLDGGRGRVEGLQLAGGDAALAIEKVDGTVVGGLRAPEGGEVVAHGVLGRRGDVAVRMATAALKLGQPGRGSPWPEPIDLTVEGTLAVSKAGSGGGAARLAVGRVRVAFDSVLAKALEGDPLGGIASVIVENPEGVVTLPDAIMERAEGPAPEDEAAPVGPDGMPLMPNDDAAMLGDRGATPSATGAGGFGALDRLFESLEPRLARLDGLTGGRIGAMARTAAQLRPEVRGATIALVDEAGAELFVLDEGAFSLGAASGGLEVRFESRVVRGGEEAGRFSVRGELGADGRLSGAELKLRGREVAGRLAALIDHFEVQPESEVDLAVTWTRPVAEGAPHHVKGRFQFKHFTFSYWRISDRPIDQLEGVVDFDVSLDTAERRLLVDLPAVRVGEGRVAASVDVLKPAGGRPAFRFRLRMPRQDCGAAAASVPKSLIPNLSTLRLRGTAQFDAALDVDLERPRELSLRVDGDLDGCEVLSLAPDIDPERLRGRFVHHPREPEKGVLTHIAVGRGTREWIPSEEIPGIVKLAAWVTEDRKWEDHGGVRWDLVASALKIDLDHGRFVYGGSTITQQLVKNLYLTRTKNLARKFEEAIIAWQMERVLEKDEILTAYINCIEYGPEVYGIRAAAAHYFDKTPQSLDALEAAFIMGLKPYPKAGQRQFERGTLDKWWIRRVSYVLRLMAKYGPELITLEEAEGFAPFQPAFRRL